MKNIMKPLFLNLFLIISFVVVGQKSELKKAESFYKRQEYFEAKKIYEQIIEKGYQLDLPSQIKLGHCYYNLNNIDKAYEIFSEIENNLTGNDLFVYASTNHKIGLYAAAVDLYKKARPQMAGQQSQIDEMIKACQWADENFIYDPQIIVNPSTLATFGQSFGIQYYDEGVVYSSASEDKGSKKSKTDKQGMTFLNLYYSDLEDGQVAGKKRLFSNNLKFDFHIGAISFTSDMKTMYYTKTVRVKGGASRLKIFKVTHNGRDWSNEQDIGINSNEFNNAHPAVSPDDKSLYFVSDRPGGYGGKDLYVVERRANGTYGSPRNLGPEVNTFGDEMFPFVSQDNVLFFSSDGHIGFGGLDLFKAEYKDGIWTNIENLMPPFNSQKDDFGYVIDPNNPRYGFISSNRMGDGTNDRIFYVLYRDEDFGKPKDEDEKTIYTSDNYTSSFITKLTSTFNNEPVPNASIIIKDLATGNIIVQGVSDNNGNVTLAISEEYINDSQEFEISITKRGEFQPKTIVVNINELDEFAKTGIPMTPIFKEQALNDIGDAKIYYTGTTFTPQGINELDKLAEYLLNNLHVVVKLNGHTECRGNQTENLNTSQAMAEKAEQYLLSKGVPKENLIPRGYGERYPINRCKRGKLCSDQEHLQNRRVEVVVWRFLN